MKHSIAFFTDSDGFGGAERYLLQIIQQMDLTRWHISLYYHNTPGITPLIEEASSRGVDLHPVPRMPLGMEGARLAPSLARSLREKQPDIFHANLTWPLSCKYGLVAAVLARVPGIFLTLHSFPPVDFSWATRLQQRLLAQSIDRYIVVSRAMGKHLQQAFWIPPAKIRVIYNGVPVEPPADDFLPVQVTAEDNRPLVFTAARLDEQKGLDYLLEAAILVPEARFVVAGDGPLCSQLRRKVSEYSLENRFFLVGFQTEIGDWLERAELFVLPSLFEGFPLSILEAMAAGKPVVATQIEGVDEAVVVGATGLLVPPADPPALAQAIRSLLAEPARAAAMGQAGKDRVQNFFSLESMVSGITDCYEAALSHQGKPA